MLSQNIDCQKCACSNKLGTIYCRNCGTKLKFDKKMLDSHKSQKVKKILTRALKAVLVLAILGIIGMAFCPWGFPVAERVTDPEEISAVLTTCSEIDNALSKQTSKARYEFTPAEATLAANYLAVEHERKKAGQAEAMSFSSSSSLGGTGKLGGASLGGKVDMKLKDKTVATPSVPAYQAEERARILAWRKRKSERGLKPKDILSPNFDFVITVKDDKTLSVVLKDKWLKILPARLELSVIPKLKINVKERTQILEYEISSARFGFLPIPLYLKEQIIELFEEMIMQERKWAKEYFARIKNVEIVKGNINVTFGK